MAEAEQKEGSGKTEALEARLEKIEARLAELETLITRLPNQIVEKLTEARTSVEATLRDTSVPLEFLETCQSKKGRRTLREKKPKVPGYIFMFASTGYNEAVSISTNELKHILLAQKDGLIWVLPTISSMRILGHLFSIQGGGDVNSTFEMNQLISLPVGK